jgi:TatA/E family protein of Tat protein translocase
VFTKRLHRERVFMFGSLGFPELLMIFVVALIVFGPRKLPEIGRTLGKALGEFKKATDELKNTIEKEVRVEELKEFKNIMPGNLFTPTVSRTEPPAAPVKPPRWPARPEEPTENLADPALTASPDAASSTVILADAAATHPTTQSDARPSPTLAETGTPGRAE